MNLSSYRKPLIIRKPIAAIAATSPEVPSDLVAALAEQADAYRRLSKLAQVQHEHIRREQTEQLLEVLAQRQELLSQIARLETVVGPAKKNWNEVVAALSADERSRAELSLAETRKLLEAITQSDKDDVLILQQRKLNLGKQIGKATAATKVNRNYAAGAYGPAKTRMDISN